MFRYTETQDDKPASPACVKFIDFQSARWFFFVKTRFFLTVKILELNFFDIHTHSADWALQIKVLKLKVFTHFSNSNFHFLHEMIVIS